ncbi:DUF2897 family protein [Rheinheimera nanhaiensis]|uniref:DUF2897 domain-containing protein n=1 Tax=Rheinheimera nanhaiensis E407-8 TaxID=562729 RepID=I1E1K9_9GAMM|nr:hypothetical protein RNAN_3206 [Rheinheimera nanhaiensis E407-8]
MNWPLFWALLLAFGVVISNILLVKHLAKIKLPPAKVNAGADKTKKAQQIAQTETTQHPAQHDQTPSNPE